MRTTLAARTSLAGLLAGLLAGALTGCGADGAPTAIDPAGAEPSSPPRAPAAPGLVETRGVVTVMDRGAPELCLGPVAESYPPQCEGPRIQGWAWSRVRGSFEAQDGIRWGEFTLTGRWDGATFALVDAVPAAAVHDATPTPSPTHPAPSVEHDREELEEIGRRVRDLLGAPGAYPHDGRVLVDVAYDDGSLQDWADEAYGAGVVVVTSLLVDRRP